MKKIILMFVLGSIIGSIIYCTYPKKKLEKNKPLIESTVKDSITEQIYQPVITVPISGTQTID